jgi:isopenicillin N synthase-like dioxygenase
MAVRTLDFARFYGSDEEQQTFAQELLEGFSESGFVKIVNHGVSLEDLAHLFAWVIRATRPLNIL